MDVNLVRDKDTGKSRGFAFLAYEDQRSTVLAVDNLSGAKVASRTIRVEHVDNYKKKRAEVEGRPESSSDEDEPDGSAAEAAVRASAAADGAEVVADADAAPMRGNVQANAARGQPGDAWATSGSIFNLLSGPAPDSRSLLPPSTARQSSKDQVGERTRKKGAKEKKSKKSKRHKGDTATTLP